MWEDRYFLPLVWFMLSVWKNVTLFLHKLVKTGWDITAIYKCPLTRWHWMVCITWGEVQVSLWCGICVGQLWPFLFSLVIMMYVYIGFKTFFYVVRHLDSIASYLPTGLHLGFFHSWPSLFLPSSFSLVFLVLSFVLASTSVLFWAVFLLPFFEHGHTMWAGSVQSLL